MINRSKKLLIILITAVLIFSSISSGVMAFTTEPVVWPQEPEWVQSAENELEKPELASDEISHDAYGRPNESMTPAMLIELRKNSQADVAEERMLSGTEIPVDKINHTTAIFINGKEYTGGDVKVTKGDSFSYSYVWEPVYGINEAPAENDWFEYVLFKIPNLTLVDYLNQPLVINGIKVGSWSLDYNSKSGEMKYRVTFNRYIQMFDMNTIRARLQGGGSFSSTTSGTNFEYNGESHSLVVVEKPGIVPSLPSGVGWKPPVPQFSNKTYPYGKGVKWTSSNDPSAEPQIDWRIVFFNYLQKMQENFLKGDEITQTKGYCILEETLDEDQAFHWTNEARFGGSPFHIELPVITVGTDQLLNGSVGYGGVNGAYDGPGEINPYIRGADLKEIKAKGANTAAEIKEVQEQVKKTPCSWTVTTDPKTKKSTLLVNLGVLGGTDPSKGITWDKARGDGNWPERGLNSRISECDKTLQSLASGDNSPITLMDERHQNTVNLLLKAIKLPANAASAASLDADLQRWRDSYQRWRRDPRVDELTPLTGSNGQVIVPLPDISLLKRFEDIQVDANGTLLKQIREYQNFNTSYSNLIRDQKTYLANHDNYTKQWSDAKMRYEKTLEFYNKRPIYGFALKVRTKSINTSMKNYRNTASISIGDEKWTVEDNTRVEFANSIAGEFALGTLVIQKADRIFDVKKENADSQKQELENIKKVEAANAGIANVGFNVYCAEGTDNTFNKDKKNLAYFMEKDASANGETYLYTHTGAAVDHHMGHLTELFTNKDGKLALGGLTPKHDHFLVETTAPKGYYKDETPIRLRSDSQKVIYDLVPNIPRSVLLKKIDSYSKKPVGGAEFALFRVNNDAKEMQITGFSKKIIKEGKSVYVPDSKGTEKLITNQLGELCIRELDPGNYVLREVRPADGYLMPEKQLEYEFTLEENLPKQRTGMDDDYNLLLNNGKAVENDPKVASVELLKVDANTGKPLKNAGFGLFRFVGTEKEWEQDPNNPAKWKKVIVEKDGVGKYFHTSGKTTEVNLPNIPGGDTPFCVVMTDSQGRLKITDIPLGHYSIQELKAPDTYHRDFSNYYFHVTKDSANQNLQIYKGLGSEKVLDNKFINHHRRVFLKLVKGDSENMPIVTGKPANDGIKYEGANISGKGLSGATYKLFMQKGYSDIPHPDPQELKNVEIVGSSIEGYDSCIAVGTTDENGVLDLKKMKDVDGKLMTEGLHIERYYLVEVEAPKGYAINQNPIMFIFDESVFPTDEHGNIRPDGEPGLVKTASNKAYDYGIQIIKKDAIEQNPLSGVGFELYKGDAPVYVKPVTGKSGKYIKDPTGTGSRVTMRTNSQGVISVMGLEPDTVYTLKETQIPKGYKKLDPIQIKTPSSPKDGVLDEDDLIVKQELFNERLPGVVSLHKLDSETSHALPGAKFMLYKLKTEVIPKDDPDYDEENPNATRVVEEQVGMPKVTDKEGNLSFENLEWGDYYIKEIEAPYGYVLSQTKHSFSIGRDSVKEGEKLVVSFPYVTNRRKDVPPTGTNLDNWSGMMLLGIGVLGIIVLLAFRRRIK